MPIYEYRCTKCQFKFERIRSVSARMQDASCDQCLSHAEATLTIPASIRMGTGTTRMDSGYNKREI